VYPNKGDETGARFLIVTSVGDMNVPASTGVTIGRAAGVIDYLHPHPDYGKPVNQVLIDTHTAEAVNTLRRYPYAMPSDNPEINSLLGLDGSQGAHYDIHNFSAGADIWGDNIPRLAPGIDLMTTVDMWGNQLQGLSGAVFPYPVPQGEHGFDLPGAMTDRAINICLQTYGSTDPQCDEENIVGNTFDVGWFMFHAFTNFVLEPQTNPFVNACSTKAGCGNAYPVPPLRDLATLP
jgi:hypothetical protein